MTLTNNYQVDSIIAAAVANDDYTSGDSDITVSQLISPPQMMALRRGHTLTEDVSEKLWALLGSAVHSILERAAPPDAVVEKRYFARVSDWLVSGQVDIYLPSEKHIRDYKITSTWSFILPDKDEWENQLNLYAAILRRNGHEVERLTVSGILRDHMKGKQYEEGYPPIPYAEKPVRVWAPEEAERYLTERVKLHQRAREGVYEPCTPEERWEKPTTYAVRKAGIQKARRVLPTREEAEHWIENNSKELERRFLTVEERVGGSIRCAQYCPVRRVCGQAAELGVEIQ